MRYMTAGESHGRALLVVIDGVPAGMPLGTEIIDAELARRQMGHGRGGRMQIERDRVEIISGVRHGATLGSPVGLMIQNRDWVNWKEEMSPGEGSAEAVVRPRPGHADLAGAHKYGHRDLRNVLERASARETAARVAAGAVGSALLAEFGIWVAGCVVAVGGVRSTLGTADLLGADARAGWQTWREKEGRTRLRCPDAGAEEEMIGVIDRAREAGDTLGGVVEAAAAGVPPGLGSYSQRDRRLDGRLAAAVMSIPGIKGVEIGLGFEGAARPGSQVHDPILPAGGGGRPRRPSNRAGGLEGGVTNGEPLVVRAGMKPIATLGRPLASIDIRTGESADAHHERSDVCAVPSAGVVVEAALAFEVAAAFLEKFGGDSLSEIRTNHDAYLEGLS